MAFEKIFPGDRISKKERVLRTLNHQEVDRVALHDQMSYNSAVIGYYNNRRIDGFNYSAADIGRTIRQTLDMCFPLFPPKGTGRYVAPDGLTYQNEEWTASIVDRPFHDEQSAAEWLKGRIRSIEEEDFNPERARAAFRQEMLSMQELIGETVLCYHHDVGLCYVWSSMGIDIFTFFQEDYPELFADYLELYTRKMERWIEAVADPALSPVVLLADDFATKQGPLFPPEFLGKYLFEPARRLTEIYHRYGLKVLFHSDGNWKKVIPDLIKTGVDGFYCLEKACGMDIVELKNQYPEQVWAGGLDGIDLMERGTPEMVIAEVERHLKQTDSLLHGGMFLASSSEINPPVKLENFQAMVHAADLFRNLNFREM